MTTFPSRYCRPHDHEHTDACLRPRARGLRHCFQRDIASKMHAPSPEPVFTRMPSNTIKETGLTSQVFLVKSPWRHGFTCRMRRKGTPLKATFLFPRRAHGEGGTLEGRGECRWCCRTGSRGGEWVLAVYARSMRTRLKVGREKARIH